MNSDAASLVVEVVVEPNIRNELYSVFAQIQKNRMLESRPFEGCAARSIVQSLCIGREQANRRYPSSVCIALH